jgi:hypothetical protein
MRPLLPPSLKLLQNAFQPIQHALKLKKKEESTKNYKLEMPK